MGADTVSPRDEGAYRLAGVTRKLLNAFFDVYHELGSGFLEAVYANALAIALTHAQVSFGREVLVPVSFRGVTVGTYRADFLVENEIVVEFEGRQRDRSDSRCPARELLARVESRARLHSELRSEAVIQALDHVERAQEPSALVCGHLRFLNSGAVKYGRPS